MPLSYPDRGDRAVLVDRTFLLLKDGGHLPAKYILAQVLEQPIARRWYDTLVACA